MRFESLPEAPAYPGPLGRAVGRHSHPRHKRQVASMFAEERPALLPLPLEPFRYYQYGERTVHLDGCAEMEAAYYSAPPGWISRRVQVQWDVRNVRLHEPSHRPVAPGTLAQCGGHRIKDENRPNLTQHAPTAGPRRQDRRTDRDAVPQHALRREEIAVHHIGAAGFPAQWRFPEPKLS
jgi:hypothetical protein